MAEDRFLKQEIPLNGKLITSRDPSTIGANNFRQLTNLRYGDTNPEGIAGMSKINTTTLAQGRYIKSGFHYVKDQPSESHILVQAFNSTLDESAIYDNTTAVPSAGNFTATALLSEPSGSSVGVWSKAPGGDIAYCNKKGAYLWGGTETKVGKFINYAPDESFLYDYTDQVADTISTGTNHIATLNRATESAPSFLMHMETATTDSSASSHTVAASGVTVTSKKKVFGTYSASFDGTNDFLRIRDRAAFNFSGAAWAIDGRVRLRSAATTNPIYYQHKRSQSATNNIKFYTDGSARLRVAFVNGASTLELKTSTALLANTWYHAEVDESGDNYYLFVDGQVHDQRSSTFRMKDLTSSVDIGWDRSNFYSGWMDEYRICKSVQHTTAFELPTEAYDGTTSSTTYIYLGATRPLEAFKLYVGTANTGTGTMKVKYWSGSAWTSVSSLVNGTAVGGVPLAQTGTVTFSSTESVAKIKVINGTVLYWYRISITGCDNTTSLYYVTVRPPFQTVKDIWDGIGQNILSCLEYNNSGSYFDYTQNVYSTDYESLNTGSYAELDDLSTARYLLCGFAERQLGVSFTFVGTHENNSTCVCSVYYWSGSAWTSVGTIEDGTSKDGKSMAKSGVISWTPPADGSEFKTEISREAPLYYYKFQWSAALDGDVQVYYISGFPAQRTIGQYAFPVMALNRLWLLSEQDKNKNKVIASALNTSQVFNGDDSLEFYIGDESEVVGGASVYMQLGSSLYDSILICKKTESWIIFYSNDQYFQYRISANKGLVAPNTMRSISLSDNDIPNARREVPIWQGAEGLYMFAGTGPIAVHGDIDDVFDPNGDAPIKASKVGNSYGFFDQSHDEYHWLYSYSNTLDKEMVFDVKRQKWFQADRGSGNALQCGWGANDTNGNPYAYGGKDRHVYRLENGSSFDGTSITHTMWLGDAVLDQGSITDETTLRTVRLICKAKNTTNNLVNGTYYKDSETTARRAFTLTPQASGKRLAMPLQQLGEGPATFHSLKFTASTDNEVSGFEPIFVGLLYKHVRQKVTE